MLSAILLAAVFVLTSCSLDEPTVDQSPDERILNASSNDLSLMQRVANKDGSWDNIIDGSSCFSVRFPYTVSINEFDITINSIEELQLIENIFDAVEEDEDILDILFPITLILADYSEITVSDEEELRLLVADCVEGGADEDIECIDFIYPIRLFTFNTNFEQTNSVTVNSDSEMRRFFIGLGVNDLVDVDFPVSFELHDGTNITVNSNAELSDAIEKAIDACDEDDDNDYSDDDFTEQRLDELLLQCPWLVNEVKRDRDNESTTNDYKDYVLNFNDDGSVVARDRQGNLFYGEWSISIANFRVVVNLSFEFITEFNLDWLVDDIDDGRIKLFTMDGAKIIIKLYCEDQPMQCDEGLIKENLGNCLWVPAQEGNSFLDNLSIDFSNMNIYVSNPNGEVVDEGNWTIERNVIVFSDLSMELANYIGEWEIVACSPSSYRLERGEETLVIEKKCE